MRANFYTVFMIPCALIACMQKNQWQDIDYSSVYRHYRHREFDADYKQPSILGCFDEDLYNCK